MKLFLDYSFLLAAGCSVLMGMICGGLGCFLTLRRESLLGDAISHAALPGLVLCFLITGTKVTELLLLGGLVTGLVAAVAILSIVRFTKVKYDSALAIVMSVWFGGGVLLLTIAQKTPNANQAGLDRFIYGQASAVLMDDLRLLAIGGALLSGLLLLFFKDFTLMCFDRKYSSCLGFPTAALNALLSAMLVAAIMLGLQTVGAILMCAMMVAPAVAARQWSDRLRVLVPLSAALGALAGFLGTLFSALGKNLPTGPLTVTCLAAIALTGMLFSPGRGLISKGIQRRRLGKRGDEA